MIWLAIIGLVHGLVNNYTLDDEAILIIIKIAAEAQNIPKEHLPLGKEQNNKYQ